MKRMSDEGDRSIVISVAGESGDVDEEEEGRQSGEKEAEAWCCCLFEIEENFSHPVF